MTLAEQIYIKNLSGYEENLAAINAAFPGKRSLTGKDVSNYLGIDQRTVRKYLKIKKGLGITKESLAKQIC